MDKELGLYCPHIESQIPKMSKGSRREMGGWDVENMSMTSTISYEKGAQAIEKDLVKFGFEKYEVDLVVSRVIDDSKMKDIVSTQGWTSVSSANYFLRKCLKKLRLRKRKDQ